MKFELHHPCSGCPFLKEGGVKFLGAARAREIGTAMASSHGSTFPCHKTVDYDRAEDGDGVVTKNSQHCAGALLFMEKVNPGATQFARIAERIGSYDKTKYTGAELVYDTLGAFVKGQSKQPK